jgi:arylsulfatase A-like enzyme
MPSDSSEQPNVLWIMSDQHNAKCTSWGDFSTEVSTPGLERLAGAGVRFDRAQCQNPICTPSRTSYLTGQYPSNHGVYGLTGTGATVEAPTLFDALSDRGYQTGAFGKIHTADDHIEGVLDESFSVYDYGSDLQRDQYSPYLRERGLLEDRDDLHHPEHDGGGQGLDGRASDIPYEHQPESVAVDRAEAFIEDAVAGGDPFCAWVTFPRPHQVYTPAQEFWDLYDDVDLPPTAFEDMSDKPPHQTPHQRHSGPDDPAGSAVFEPRTQEAFLERKLRGYLGCVSMVDACVDRLLDALERAGVREDTIVIYCADHGDFAAEHGFGEKAPGISYGAITRVPFVWSWPDRFAEGAVVEELVESVDMMPTLLSVIDGVEVPAADGEDLTGLLTGEDRSAVREYAITENAWARTVRTKDQSLTVDPPGVHGQDSEEDMVCYDLTEDHWEATNLAESAAPPSEAIDEHLAHLREFLMTQRRATSDNSVSRVTGSLADGTIPPREIAAHLAANGGDNYL